MKQGKLEFFDFIQDRSIWGKEKMKRKKTKKKKKRGDEIECIIVVSVVADFLVSPQPSVVSLMYLPTRISFLFSSTLPYLIQPFEQTSCYTTAILRLPLKSVTSIGRGKSEKKTRRLIWPATLLVHAACQVLGDRLIQR